MTEHLDDRDIDRLVASMVSGFVEDPLYRWLYPDAAERPALLRTTFSLVLRSGLDRGFVDHSDDLDAVAIWTPPSIDLLDANGAARWQDLLKRDAPRRFDAALSGMAACEALSPPHGSWTLHSIVVAADRQAGGLGSSLLRRGLHRVDAAGGRARLESSNPRNVTVYERHGFRSVGEVVLDDGPTIRPMTRGPSAPGASTDSER